MDLNVSSANWRPVCLGLNVLTQSLADIPYNEFIRWYIYLCGMLGDYIFSREKKNIVNCKLYNTECLSVWNVLQRNNEIHTASSVFAYIVIC